MTYSFIAIISIAITVTGIMFPEKKPLWLKILYYPSLGITLITLCLGVVHIFLLESGYAIEAPVPELEYMTKTYE